MSIRYWATTAAAIAGFATAGAAQAESVFTANLDSSQVVDNPSDVAGTASALFELNDEQTQLRYTVQFDGLDLIADEADRTADNAVTKLHLHSAPVGVPGPHILNIFGLPSEDDDDLVVDYDAETISGVYEDSDAIDPETGELFDLTVDGTTKPLSNYIEDLLAGDTYIAAHTAGLDGAVAIRGQILAADTPSVIPTPTAALAGLAMLSGLTLRRRSR